MHLQSPENNRDGNYLGSFRSNDHFCAGRVVRPDVFKTLTDLTSNPNDFLDGVRSIKDDLVSIAPELYRELFNQAKIFKQLLEGIDREKPQELIAEEKANALTKNDEEVKNYFLDYRRGLRMMEQSGNSFEDSHNAISQILNTLSFFMANDKIPHKTDIAEAISAISPLGQCQVDTTAVFRTLISPHLLRSIFVAIIKERESFISELQNKNLNITHETILNALKDEDDFTLTCLAEDEDFKISQDGFNVTISWSNPVLLGKKIYEERERFNLSSQQELLRALDGDITTEINRDEIKVTLHLPHQEEPFLASPFTEKSPIYDNRGVAAIKANTSTLMFNIPHSDSEPSSRYQISIDPKCLEEDDSKNGLIALLKLSQRLDFNNSISSITTAHLSRKTDIATIFFSSPYTARQKEDGISSIFVNSQLLQYQQIADEICRLVDSVNCTGLMLTDSNPKIAHKKLLKISSLVAKARDLTNDDVTLLLKDDKTGHSNVQIRNTNGKLLVNALYLPEDDCFVGRFHTAELTDQALQAFDSIYDFDVNNPTQESRMKSNMNEVKKLCKALKDKHIYPSLSFKKYLTASFVKHNLITDTRSPHSLFLKIRKNIEDGMVTLEKRGKKIFIDCLNSSDDFDEFALFNMIYLNGEENYSSR